MDSITKILFLIAGISTVTALTVFSMVQSKSFKAETDNTIQEITNVTTSLSVTTLASYNNRDMKGSGVLEAIYGLSRKDLVIQLYNENLRSGTYYEYDNTRNVHDRFVINDDVTLYNPYYINPLGDYVSKLLIKEESTGELIEFSGSSTLTKDIVKGVRFIFKTE